MKNGGRTRNRVVLFAIAALVAGLPAVAFHALCFGRTCDAVADASSETPFCSLPPDVRSAIARGFYEQRSGEIIAVAETSVTGGTAFDRPGPQWPSVSNAPAAAAVSLSGPGVESGAELGDMGLDDVAATVASLIGLNRPHPEVRSGRPADVANPGSATQPRLVLEVIWKGVSAEDLKESLDRLPNVKALIANGASSFSVDPGSLPVDPAAMITTIGTGGVPADHGITGTLLRNDRGELVTAWGRRSPVNVIATLGDHLDESSRNRAVIGGVGTHVSDRGLIGGLWYPERDTDPFSVLRPDARPKTQAKAAIELLRREPFGRDSTVDLLASAQSGTITELDKALGDVVRAARARTGGSVLVTFAAIDSETDASEPRLDSAGVARRVERSIPGRFEIIEATALGSFYLDQQVLADRRLSDDVALRSLFALKKYDRPVFADVFPAIAITFGRYCDG